MSLCLHKLRKNLDKYYEKKEDEDGSVIMYNQGADIPQVIRESFETGDLSAVITNTRNLIADVIRYSISWYYW